MVETRLSLDGRDLVAHSYQDVEDIIEENKRWQNERQRGDFRKVASIPLNIINAWLNEEWARGNTGLQFGNHEFDLLVQHKLNDPDWRWLRTA
jgi:hypothetical protein